MIIKFKTARIIILYPFYHLICTESIKKTRATLRNRSIDILLRKQFSDDVKCLSARPWT